MSPPIVDKPRILIVGAGIAGLTLAVGLERHGITPTIVEIANVVLTRGLGLLLTSNALLALRRVGLDAEVIKNGIVQEHFINADASEAPISDYDFRPLNAKYAPNIGVTRRGLMDGLRGGLRAQIRLSTTIAALQSSAGGAHVSFSDGTHAHYDLVVGADGIKSQVRSLIYPDVEPVYRSFCAWRTVMDYRNLESDGVVVRHNPGCILGSLKVGANRVYVFVLAHEPNIPLLSRGDHLERLKEFAGRFRGDVPSLMREQRDPERVIFVPVYEVDTAPYYRGRVVLLGDAAHAFPPVLAQGAAMAIEDGVALSQLLGSSGDIEWSLASYDSRRRSRADSVRAQVRQRGITFGLEGPVTPELLKRHPPVSPNPAAIFDSLIEEFL